MSSYTTIQLDVSHTTPLVTSVAAVSVTPGMFLARDSNGLFCPHNLEDGICNGIIAVENYVKSKGIDDLYAAGSLVLSRNGRDGDIFLGWLAPFEVVSVGDLLVSKGDGTLKKVGASPSTGSLIATSLESITNGQDAVRFKIEIF